jgi:hypothetical protein
MTTRTTKIPSADQVHRTVSKILEVSTLAAHPQATIVTEFNCWLIRLPGLNVSDGERARVELVNTVNGVLGSEVCDHLFFRSATFTDPSDDEVRIHLEIWKWANIRDMPLVRLRAETMALYESLLDRIYREIGDNDDEDFEQAMQDEIDALWAQRSQSLMAVTEGHRRYTQDSQRRGVMSSSTDGLETATASLN